MCERSVSGCKRAVEVCRALLGALPACVAVLVAACPATAAIDVRATVDRNDVAVGESFMVTVEVSGAQNVPAPDLGDLRAFHAEYLGPSTQVSIVNGQISARISHRYRMTAGRAGHFTLGPFRVEYEGRSYQTAAIPMRVAGRASARSGGAPSRGRNDPRLVVLPGKTQVYVGERIPLDVKLFIGSARVDDLQFPKIAGDGVILDTLTQPTRRQEVVGGRRYQTLRFGTAMTALRPGTIELSATMGMNMLVSRRRRGGGRFFDQFFGGAFAERKPVEVRAEQARLTVFPLPVKGRPGDFSGALGRFSFTLDAKPTDLAAGDPITVQMRIGGTGNLSGVEAPAIPVDDRFRAYDPQPVKEEEAEGVRVFEQVLIPEEPGIAELPPVRFSFFDPDAAAYRTITRGPIALTVREAPAGDAPRIIAPPGAAEQVAAPQVLGRDIVYIKDAPGRLRARGAAFYSSGWFAAAQLLPFIGFVGLFCYIRRRERLAADPRLVRFRQAGREARRVLSGLGRDAGTPARFYDELSAAVCAYLSAKLDLPPGAVDRERVLASLTGSGCSDELRERIDSFFHLAERVRYAAGTAADAERDTALALARGIVDGLERGRWLGARSAAAVLLVALLSLPLVATGRSAPPPGSGEGPRAEPAKVSADFFQGNAAYADGRYADAVGAYARVMEAGFESGAVHFNLGNAHFRAGELGQAILSYERALRISPRDPDVRANLSYARELAETEVDVPATWQRLAFPFTFRATAGEMALVASALWFAVWGSLAVIVAVPAKRVGAGRAAWVASVLFVFAAGSFAVRLAHVELREAAVVTVAGEMPVRFEPSSIGTEHFAVRQGTVLDVTDEREGWLQVRRQDGRRGWIPSDAVTPL